MACVGDYEIITETLTLGPPSDEDGQLWPATVAMPEGKRGLYAWTYDIQVSRSYPASDGTEWEFLFRYSGTNPPPVTVHVSCAALG